MAFVDFFKGFVTKHRNAMYMKMLNGGSPIFSQFGKDIYASDVVQNCIDVIATEISKLQPKHIRTMDNSQSEPKGNLNRLFRYGPNDLMTTSDFLEKIIWLLFTHYNAFIVPMFEQDGENRTYTAFYPINPSRVEFMQDPTGVLLIKFHFQSGVNFILRYADVIHIRKKYSMNEIMGGGVNGTPDNAALLKTLQIDHTAMQGLDKAVRTSLAIRGVLKISTLADDEQQRAERKRIEQLIASGESGILPLDMKGEYTPITSDVKFIDKDTLTFIQSRILNWHGVSWPILTGDYTDEQYQAFYEKALEPIVIKLGQGFTKSIFTPRQLDVGNEIVFYQKDMQYLSTSAKLNLLKTAGEQGLLTDNQKLALIGYPPIEGGDRRTQSLNYIDVKLINQYQLTQGQAKKTKAVDESE